MRKDESVTISLVITQGMKEEIKKRAKKEERTFSNMLRKIISEKLKA